VICAQGTFRLVVVVDPSLTLGILGGEGGGHTGETPFSILIPACVDAVKGHKSPLTGEPVMVVAAGIRYLPTPERKVT